jgi:hypothetical protein
MDRSSQADNENYDDASSLDRHSFTQQLVQALREADDQQNVVKSKNQQELAHETYQLLCYDDPVHVSVAGCQALAKALLDPFEQKYALSNRLVEGIRQLTDCHRQSYSNKQAATAQEKKVTPATEKEESFSTTEKNEQQPPESLLLSTRATDEDSSSESQLAAAYAMLAWTVHACIPLTLQKFKDFWEAFILRVQTNLLLLRATTS